MNGEVIHSKIPPDAKLIVDVGCGTGAMTLSLAFRNPSAAVIGLDLSRVPETHVTPPNVLYIQGDVRLPLPPILERRADQVKRPWTCSIMTRDFQRTRPT